VLTSGQKTTRWEEARERLLILFSVLAYVPVAGVRVQFLNRRDVIELSHAGHHPASFIKTASEQINRIFARPPSQGTPLFDNLNPIFTRAKQRPGRTAVYLFFDGEPSEGSGPTERLLLSRPAAKIPFTFVTVFFLNFGPADSLPLRSTRRYGASSVARMAAPISPCPVRVAWVSAVVRVAYNVAPVIQRTPVVQRACRTVHGRRRRRGVGEGDRREADAGAPPIIIGHQPFFASLAAHLSAQDGSPSFMAELDDFDSERKEVLHDQVSVRQIRVP
jgi:hypothetical protein